MLDQQVQARRAIEALRAGVPNRDAVQALGSAAEEVQDHFRGMLSAARESAAHEPSAAGSGFLVAGDFGAGKSHLLEYLQHLAREQNFVTSKVVISKETPLHDPTKLYRAAIRAAVVPGRRGAALPLIAAELTALNFQSARYVDFYKWVQQPGNDLNQRFAATVFLYERAHADPELRDRIISFWAGDPIQVGEIRRALRQLGERVTYALDKIDARSLALQRFRFAARLMLAAGFSGWVLLVDEVELVGRYTLNQRARSYAEIARWTGNLKGETYAGITAVLAITSDFEAAILNDRNDHEAVPGKLRASSRETDHLLASQAERGMRVIRQAVKLARPTRPVVDETKAKIQAIHGLAYGWNPPEVGSVEFTSSTVMREYVRWWITEWDLKRLFPEYEPDIEVRPVLLDYTEDAELETPAEGDSDASDPEAPPRAAEW
jgi:hypothetical protein